MQRKAGAPGMAQDSSGGAGLQLPRSSLERTPPGNQIHGAALKCTLCAFPCLK